jgi:putative ABC transport system permease protein
MMRFMEIIRIAVDSLMRHKTRAILTMLGIIIGVGAVVAMVAIGQGAQNAVESQIASLGSNVIMIFPGASTRGGVSSGAGGMQSLTLDDVQAIKEQCPAVGAISPAIRTNRQVVAGNLNWMTSIQGGYPDFFQIREWSLQSGEFFTDQDERAATKVCVIGETVKENLFPNQDAVGQIIRIGNIPFKVIGVLASKGQTGMGNDQDDLIIAPFSTIQRRVIGTDWVSQILISAVSKNQMTEAQDEIRTVLRIRHKLQDRDEDDFFIRTQSDIATAATATSSIMTILLGSIASVSLLVGGVGIMNIMLVSVTERTREIGMRMSIGARRKDILQQFLLESIMLSVLGGIVGLGLGLVASSLISRFAGWPVLVSPASMALAFLFAAAVGMFFGYYPAYKASRLSPIEALRYE